MKRFDINSITNIIPDLIIIGNKSLKFSDALPLSDSTFDSISWMKPGKENGEKLLVEAKASFIVIDNEIALNEKLLKEKCFIRTASPKLTFIRIIDALFNIAKLPGIHSTAVIDHDAVISKHVFIGPHTIIGKVKIGEGTIIDGNCFIYDNVIIGKNVVINANTVIGSCGYGYSRNENNEFEKFPHIGGVVIEDNVEIGSNTSIDRGALGNTIIKEGAKIDNLVHIAHNVIIGKHTAVIANAMIGGSVYIEDYSWVAPSAAIMNQIKIGSNSTVGLGAVVTKDIPSNEVWVGSPARPLKDFIKVQKKLKELLNEE